MPGARTVNPAEVAARWAEEMAKIAKFGMLCRGCGYRIPAGEWLMSEASTLLACPYCYTIRGSL